MSKRLWLPTGTKPFPFATDDERELLINRLWELKYAVPGARKMEIQQLRDYVAYAEKRVADELYREELQVAAGAQIVSQMPPEQVRGALNEFLAWRRRKQGLPAPKPLE